MKVSLRTDGPIRRWHARVGERLGAAGHALTVSHAPGSRLQAAVGPMITLERRLYGATSELFVPIGTPSEEPVADLVLTPRFDGVPGERALMAALLAGRAPFVEIVDATGRVRAAGLPAVERPEILATGLEHALARAVHLVAAAVEGRAQPAVSDRLAGPIALPAPLFFARTFASKLRGKLARSDSHLPPWRIALRPDDARDEGAPAWEGAPFVEMTHDGKRFEADPFVLVHAGRTCLFYEDFPFATRKGVIAMREMAVDGRWSPPRVVLEEPFHLSYPHVLVVDGEVYMLPEMSAAGRLQLYRADPFPDRFVPDRVLLDGLEANDATMIEHEGSWWLFATLSGDGGSTWDALGLFKAPHPFGPWTPHRANPVLIDAGAARPAGAMWHRDGALMRVAQDCRAGYGHGLAICRVDRLDGDGYAQTVVERLGPPAGHGAQGVHTWNRAGGFEIIDLV